MVKMIQVAIAVVVLSVAGSPDFARAQMVSQIDFEGLPPGLIVNEVSSGAGVSGDPMTGSITIFGDTPDPAITTNAGILFDATCTPGGTPADCTGDDDDLFKPYLGNVLIMALYLTDLDGDGLVDDPNDSDLENSVFTFDFSSWGSGRVTVISSETMDVDDAEVGGKFEMYSGGPGGTLLKTVPIPLTGDNGADTISLGVGHVDFMRVVLNGSGALDNIVIAPPFCGDGTVDAGEECDDGNNDDGDCCSSTCQFELEGECCDDADACSINSTCDGAGTCQVEGIDVLPCPEATVEADVTADSEFPAENFGSRDFLEIDLDAPIETFVRVAASGIAGRAVSSARLRLQVSNSGAAGSNSGGRIHQLSDCTWSESTLTWNNRPSMAPTSRGPVLDLVGAVSPGQVVEFDVTSAIPDDGVYCFVIQSPSSNTAKYNAREAAAGQPQLLIDVGCECGTPPTPECGNGQVETGEECDDGNTDDGDCCSAACEFEPPEASCEVAGNACLIGQCNACGVCLQQSTVTCPEPIGPCDGGQVCNPDTGSCEDAPDLPQSTECPDTDGNPCTTAGCDGDGSCDQDHILMPTSTPCPDTDDDACTTAGCDATGNCDQDHQVVSCDPVIDSECDNGETCNPSTGLCDANYAPESQQCSDTDGNPCTTAGCDGAGSCDQDHILAPNSTVCPDTDGNPCTTAGCDGDGSCDQNHILMPTSTPCPDTDDNQCTTAGCDGAGSCDQDHQVVSCDPVIDSECDNGETCNPSTGLCDTNYVPESQQCSDTDGNPCTTAGCDGAGSCDQDHILAPNSTVCPDTDGNPCTTAGCDGDGSCDQDHILMPTSTPCPDTDDNQCTTAGCDGAGACDQDHQVVSCDPVIDSECDNGETCNPSTGLCDANYAPESQQCSDTDGNPCTTAGCDGAGSCDQYHILVPNSTVCPDTDGNPCTTAGCDGDGSCDQNHILMPNSTPCPDTDDNQCTTAGCDGAGACDQDHQVVSCDPVIDSECDDGETCNPSTGLCDANYAPESQQCSDTDGNPCTTAGCDGAGSCDQDHILVPNSTVCPDTDGNPCTTAGCDGDGSCDQNHILMPTSTPCPDTDDNECTTAGCDGAGACDQNHTGTPCVGECLTGACDLATGRCVPEPTSTSCSDTDGNECTTAGCDGAGDCDQSHILVPESTACTDTDENECTTAGCDGAGTCDQGHILVTESTTCTDTDENECTTAGCDGAGTCDQSHILVPESTTCTDTDGNVCTTAGCTATGTCDQSHIHEPDGTPCEENGFCDVFGDCLIPPPPPDHFKCYRTRQTGGSFEERNVTLEDQFATTDAMLTKPKRFCNPVNKEDEGITDPTAHLMCYKIREPRGKRQKVIVENQFGEMTLSVGQADTLCLPAEKDGVPSELNINHFKCYNARRAMRTSKFEPLEVNLADQFEQKLTEVVRPRALCTPVDKNGEGIKDPEGHLVCYRIKDTPGQPSFERRGVEVEDQFSSQNLNTVRGSCSRSSFLCVPSTKRLVGETTTTLPSSTTTTLPQTTTTVPPTTTTLAPTTTTLTPATTTTVAPTTTTLTPATTTTVAPTTTTLAPATTTTVAPTTTTVAPATTTTSSTTTTTLFTCAASCCNKDLLSFETGIASGTGGTLRNFRCSNNQSSACADDSDCGLGFCWTNPPIFKCSKNFTVSCASDADCQGTCAEVIAGNLPLDLQRGGLYTGGGLNSVPLPFPVPDQGLSYAKVTVCDEETGELVVEATTRSDLASIVPGCSAGTEAECQRHCTQGRTCQGGTDNGLHCVLADDCPGGTCNDNCIFGPPLPIPNAGTPATSVCTTNVIDQDAFGTTLCDGGDTTMEVPLRSVIYLNGDLFKSSTPPDLPGVQPCPICVPICSGGLNGGLPCRPDNPYRACAGGAKAGRACMNNSNCPSSTCRPARTEFTDCTTGGGSCPSTSECLGGPNDGSLCTPATSTSDLLGDAQDAYPTSHDCGNDPLASITDNIGGLPVNFSMTTGTMEWNAVDRPSGKRNFCGFCRDVSGAGSLCFEGDTSGGCPTAVPPADGNGVPCSSDGQCAADGDEYESCVQRDPGAFSEAAATRITVAGSTDGGCLGDGSKHTANLVGLFCIPPTFDSTVDAAGDLPGPGGALLQGNAQLQ